MERNIFSSSYTLPIDALIEIYAQDNATYERLAHWDNS
jgi:hypothetical protein